MAFFRALFLTSLLALLVLHAVDANTQTLTGNGTGTYPSDAIDCDAACPARCRLSSRQNLCRRACGTCCRRCNCVPPGTSGDGRR